MPKPSEHKSVQARILACAEAFGWTLVSREDAEARSAGFPTRRLPRADGEECPPSPAPAPSSLFFPSLLDTKVREFNPRCTESTDALGFSYGVTWNTVRRNIFTWAETGRQRTRQLHRLHALTVHR